MSNSGHLSAAGVHFLSRTSSYGDEKFLLEVVEKCVEAEAMGFHSAWVRLPVQ